MIPKLSAPLVKDIRTGEGVLEWLLGAAIAAAAATSNLSISHSALYLTILAGVKGARRGLLKIVAITQPAVGAPIPFGPLTTPGTASAGVRQITLSPTRASAPVDEQGWPA